MRYRDAAKLHNRDQVTLKKSDEAPEHVAMILGEPEKTEKTIILPIQSSHLGYVRVDHTRIK